MYGLQRVNANESLLSPDQPNSLAIAFLALETLQIAGPLRSTDITPLPRYCGPSRHPLVFGRLTGVAGYTAWLAPAISRRDEEGFSSCSACPCHRAVASTPPR